MPRFLCACLFVLGLVSSAASQEFTPPPKAERDLVATLAKLNCRISVDGEYRVISANLSSECTNEELKALAACERLANVYISSPKITDEGLAHLRGLTNLKTVSIATSGTTAEGVAALRKAYPDAQVTTLGSARGAGGAPATRGPASGSAGGRTFGGSGGPTSSFSSSSLSRSTSLLRNAAIQDELKLTPEQRTQITEATNSSALSAVMKLIEEKAQAALTAEQKARLKQLELQQGGPIAVIRADVIPQLKVSADQVAAIQKLNDELTAESREVTRAAFADRPAGESTEDTLKKMREKAAEFTKKREEKILALLTEEQRTAWSALTGPKGPEVNLTGGFFAAGSSTAGPGGRERVTDPTAIAKSMFTQYDADKDGKLTETEFPATNRTRTAMTAAGITLVYPVTSEVFVENYLKYIQSRTRDRGGDRDRPR